jgi:hypothetical protein
MDPIPPVIDVERQLRMEEGSVNPMYNLIALVVVLFFAFFLYKRYKDKKSTERAHS